ncbi:MAG: hypothetical protein ACW98K_13975 [Candidatus Kariarchaeaceae archaeon]|jgi:sensor histidine kinase YesM
MFKEFELKLKHNFPPEVHHGVVIKKKTKRPYVSRQLGQYYQHPHDDQKINSSCPACNVNVPVIIRSKNNQKKLNKFHTWKLFLTVIIAITVFLTTFDLWFLIVTLVLGYILSNIGYIPFVTFDEPFNSNNKLVSYYKEHEIELKWIV